MRHYPAYTHWDVLRTPWRTFWALIEEIEAARQRARTARYFRGNPALEEEWEENREAWLRAQGLDPQMS